MFGAVRTSWGSDVLPIESTFATESFGIFLLRMNRKCSLVVILIVTTRFDGTTLHALVFILLDAASSWLHWLRTRRQFSVRGCLYGESRFITSSLEHKAAAFSRAALGK